MFLPGLHSEQLLRTVCVFGSAEEALLPYIEAGHVVHFHVHALKQVVLDYFKEVDVSEQHSALHALDTLSVAVPLPALSLHQCPRPYACPLNTLPPLPPFPADAEAEAHMGPLLRRGRVHASARGQGAGVAATPPALPAPSVSQVCPCMDLMPPSPADNTESVSGGVCW